MSGHGSPTLDVDGTGLTVVVVYVAILALMRAPELKAAGSLVRHFLPGR